MTILGDTYGLESIYIWNKFKTTPNIYIYFTTPILSHTYGLESIYIYGKVQKSSKYIFDDPHSEPYVWPRIEIDR